MSIQCEIEYCESRIDRLVRMIGRNRSKPRGEKLLAEIGRNVTAIRRLQECERAYTARYQSAFDDPTGQDLDDYLAE